MGRKAKLLLITTVFLTLFGAGCAQSQNFDDKLNTIVQPYGFNLAGWELSTLWNQLWSNGSGNNVPDESGTVIAYFTLVQQINSLDTEIQLMSTGDKKGDSASQQVELDQLEKRREAATPVVEQIINKQISTVLAEQGIYNPINSWQVQFPPLNFQLENPPNVLVISPCDHIQRLKDILLQPGLSVADQEKIEAEVDKMGVSSLVVSIGGVATYPSFVVDKYGLRFTIDAATEEWMHQYLVFRPLGFRYVLDQLNIARNDEIATLNETLAGMVSQEIGGLVYQKYYAKYETGNGQQPDERTNLFYAEMRDIRKTVDQYLARGEVDQAEQYMEAQRQHLASQGFFIRKLNQAYFAFYGSYADSPGSVNPIGTEMAQFRAESASLKDFLNAASGFTGQQQLQQALKTISPVN